MFTKTMHTSSNAGTNTSLSTPHLARRFRVRFFEDNKEYPELTDHVLNVSSHVYSAAVSALTHQGYVVRGLTITFQDDETNKVAERITDLHDRGVIQSSTPASVTVQVEMLDSNDTVVRTHTHVDCVVSAPEFSALDYTTTDTGTIVVSFVPSEVRIAFP